MDIRSASLMIVTTLAAAGTAQASSVVLTNPGQSLPGVDAVSQFVGFMLDDSTAAITISDGNGAIESNGNGSDAPFVAADFAFDGSLISMDLASEAGVGFAAQDPFGGSWGGAPLPAIVAADNGGGFGTIEVVPLPAPVAMGGVGLLSLAGFGAWRRRARA